MNGANESWHIRALSAVTKLLKARPILSAALSGVVAIGSAGAHQTFRNDESPAATARVRFASTNAINRFWAVYHGNNYNAIPEVQEQLERAIRLDPSNPTLYALLGATHFWRVSEYTRDPNPDFTLLRQDMPAAASLFKKALDLDYYGEHQLGYVNDDHLPGYLGITTVHTGQQNSDPSLIAQGNAILEYAVYQFPEFNNFNRWAAHNTDPKDSETYKSALESLWQGIDSCIAGRIDRANPDIRPYLYLATSVGRKKACWWDSDLAPYSFEGYMLNLGNGLVKAGQVDAARIVYASARYAENYATWPYRDVLEAIEASNLAARAALYADGDPGNDPPLAVPNRGCSYCHARVPEPAVR
jgi:hypothetical protein